MSFGGGGFGSSGFGSANNNNQQSSGLFGSGGGFGSNNANNTSGSGFGSSTNTGFGSANTGGSLFGGGTNTSNTGFGTGSTGFGSNNNNTSNSSSLFGGNRPAFGGTGNTGSGSGGLFGNSTNNTSSGFGSGSTGFGSNTANNTASNTGFGSNTTGGSMFGNTANTSNTLSGFGSSNNTGSGMFGGGGSNNSGFGSNTGGFGSGTGSGFGGSNQNPGTGGITTFQPFSEKEGVTGTSNYQSVAFQQPYSAWSFEELRSQDYDQGRKYGNQNGQGGAFGQSTGFGGTSTTNNNFGASSGGFGSGSGSGFGNQQNSGSGFGQQSSGFGSNSGGGLFGQQNNKPAPLFGGASTSGQAGGGLFGTANNNNNSSSNSGGLFGNSNTGGSFGANKSTFGSNTSGFGSNANSGFGNTSSTGNAFGSGFSNQNQNNQSSGGLFGGFNNNQNSANTAAKPLFGGSNTGTSLFGNNQQSNQQQNQNPFGGGASNQPNTGANLFGKPTGGGLFGNTNNASNTGNSLFGGTNNQNQPGSGGLFGQQQQKPSLFGNPPANTNTGFGGSGFGSSLNLNTNNQQNGGGGLFGGTSQSQPQLGNSLFGNSLQPQQSVQPQQSQSLSGSTMNDNPYGNPQLFADLNTTHGASIGPIATPLSASQRSRRPTPLPQWQVNPYASTRLITPAKRPGGYGFSYSTYGTPSSAYSSSNLSQSMTGGGLGAHTLNKSLSVGNMRSVFSPEESLLSPSAFSPSLRASTGRGSMKRLHIDRGLNTNFDFFSGADAARGSQLKKNVSFDQDPSSELGEGTSNALVRRNASDETAGDGVGHAQSSSAPVHDDGDDVEAGMDQVNGNASRTTRSVVASSETPAPPDGFAQRVETARANRDDQPVGVYWLSPKLQELKNMSREQLRSIEQFTVGRHGVAKVVFDKVNLQGVNLDDICGKIVFMDMRQISVYPDERNKPPQGRELNVPAICYVENSWPRSHQGRVKIMENSGPKIERHLRRLKEHTGTEFKSFDFDTGVWIFRVQHFSTYQLNYEQNLSSSILSAAPDSIGPVPTEMDEDPSMMSNGSFAHDSQVDDTFEFRKSRKSMPGGFDLDFFDAAFPASLEDTHVSDHVDAEAHTQNSERHQPSPPIIDLDPEIPQEFTRPGLDISALDGQYDQQTSNPSVTNATSFQSRFFRNSTQWLRPTQNSPVENLIDAEEDTWAGQLQKTLSPKKQDRRFLRDNQGALLKDQESGEIAFLKPVGIDKPFTTSFDIMNSLFGKSSPSTTQRGKKQIAGEKDFQWPIAKRSRISGSRHASNQTGVASHPSFNPSFTLDGRLLTSTSRKDIRPPMVVEKVFRSSQGTIQASRIFPEPIQSPTFSRYRKVVRISTTSKQLPVAEPSGPFTFASFAGSLTDTAKFDAEKATWDLLQILFDDQDSTLSAPIIDTTRKTLLSKFWKSIVTPKALEQVRRASSSEQKALAYLSANDVWSATEALLAGGNPKLASMVSQIGAIGDAGKAATRKQLQHWRNDSSISEIPDGIRAIYELLAGNACTAVGKTNVGLENRAENFCISAQFGMDWKQAFGLRLWYGVSGGEPLEKAVEQLDEDLKTFQEQIRPVPGRRAAGWRDPHVDERTDVLWSLLKLYAASQKRQSLEMKDIADLLAPENVSGNPLDAQLSFLLCQTLKAKRLVRPPSFPSDTDENDKDLNHMSDSIASTLISQYSGSPANLPESLFVALHLSDPFSRQSAVENLLSSHAASLGPAPSDCDIWRTIDQDLKIPASYIYSAKAAYARSTLHDEKARCLYLLRADAAVEATDVLKHIVAPAAVVAEELLPSRSAADQATTGIPRDLKAILTEFENNASATTLAGWTRGLGGAAYSRFVAFVELTERKKRSGLSHYKNAESHELERLEQEIRDTLPEEGSREEEEMTLRERVASWEIVRVVEDVRKSVRAQEEDVSGFATDGGEGEMTLEPNLIPGLEERVGRWREVAGYA